MGTAASPTPSGGAEPEATAAACSGRRAGSERVRSGAKAAREKEEEQQQAAAAGWSGAEPPRAEPLSPSGQQSGRA